LLPNLLVVELVVYKLFSGTFLLLVRIGCKSAFLLFCILNVLLDFINLLSFPIQKSLLPSNKLVFFLVFLSPLLGFSLRNDQVNRIRVNVLNVVFKVGFVRRLNYALLVLLPLNGTRVSFDRCNRK
jgi:hypothetical protein